MLWILLVESLIALEALPIGERVQAEQNKADSEVERKVLFLVNALYCVSAAALAGLLCLVVYSIYK